MAQRAKGRYRGRTYTRPSQRPGKRKVRVRAYCRRKGTLERAWEQAARKAKEWGF